jgi:lysophospholipase L1-like esterase
LFFLHSGAALKMLRLLLLLLVLLLAASPARTHEGSVTDPASEAACPDLRLPPASVPRLRAVLARDVPAVIVAVGSSSTQGWMASDAAHTYPAVLQAALAEALPRDHIAVINRGIGGQDAAQEVARLVTDAIAVRPQLVIWQVGANGALENIDLTLFRHLVTDGVQRMHGAGIDVILMSNQRAPRILAAHEHATIDQALAQVAAATGATLFDRGGLMDAWRALGEPYSDFIAADGLHHNDRGYRCVAEALAGAIVAGVRLDSPRS